jgi:hypothetical protein
MHHAAKGCIEPKVTDLVMSLLGQNLGWVKGIFGPEQTPSTVSLLAADLWTS